MSIRPIDETPELTLISYQGVYADTETLGSFLRRPGNRVMVVLDEAHKIKNVDGGVWASSVLNLANHARARVVLTGTPVPNGYEDIYNLYEFIWPGKEIIDFNVFQLKEMSAKKFDARVDKLIDNVAPFSLEFESVTSYLLINSQ
jgi:superfamily II DNA or RNA helicase